MIVDTLRDEIIRCTSCSFHCSKFPPLPPVSVQVSARLVIVGENPSRADNQAEPFSSSTISGLALRKHYLEPLGLHESEVWITDLFKCRYPKDVYHEKAKHEKTIQNVAQICAQRWLTREIIAARAPVIVTLSDKQVFSRLCRIFDWDVPSTFARAAGCSYAVQVEGWKGTLFPMVHPDVSRPIGDGITANDVRGRNGRPFTETSTYQSCERY